MNKILLVDVSSLFHRSYHALSSNFEAVDLDGNPCTGTFGFFTSLIKTINDYGPFEKYVFALDVKGSTDVRKKKSSEYKSNRTTQKEIFYKDIDNLIKNYIPMLGIQALGLKGYEADDIIASACKVISTAKEESEVYIISGDSDLELCIEFFVDSNSKVFFIKTQPELKLLTMADVVEKWGGVEPKDIALIKAIIGDSSDTIQGIKGYKLQRALRVYKNEEWLNKPEIAEIIAKNLDIIRLRADLEPIPRKINLSYENLEKIFLKLESKSLLLRLRRGTLLK